MLDRTDLRMALVAVEYYRRAHRLIKRPVPLAADLLADRLQAMAANGPDDTVRQQHWLTTAEVAARLGISERHARRIATRHGKRVGRQWLTAEEVL